MENKEEMANLISINMTLYQSLTKSQEAILVLSKQLQALQAHMDPQKTLSDKPATDKKQYPNN